MAAAVLDQVGDGADFQTVFFGKNQQVGQPGHGAIVLHDLADHRGGGATGHGGQIATGFGVTGAHQHAAVNRLQRKDMAGLHQVIDLGVFGDCRLNGARTVCRRNAGGHAFGRFNRNREGGAFFVAIAQRHGWQLQALAALAGERQADQAATEARHEIDGFWRHVVGGQHQVAFVFAVFFIDQDDDLAGGHVGHDVFNGRN